MELNKKAIFISLGLVAAVIISAVLYQFVFKKEEVEPVSPAVPVGEPAEVLAPLVTWEDPAGFSFDYPGNLQTDSHEEDRENYAHLELSSADHAGGIIVWMKDTAHKTIADWAKKESEAVSEQIFAITLGGHEAKKVMLTDGRVITAALDKEVIVLVELLPGDNHFWQPIYDQIIKSFEFIPLASEKLLPPASSGGNEIWEEEEVVE